MAKYQKSISIQLYSKEMVSLLSQIKVLQHWQHLENSEKAGKKERKYIQPNEIKKELTEGVRNQSMWERDWMTKDASVAQEQMGRDSILPLRTGRQLVRKIYLSGNKTQYD